jgi:hypothetical protein
MSTYSAPLRDMLFAMKEHGGLDAVRWRRSRTMAAMN